MARLSKKKKLLNIKRVFFFFFFKFSFLFVFILKRNETLLYMYIDLHEKYPLFLSDFNENLIISIDFRKTLEYQIS
jgi:hypothetical protein